MRRAGFHQRKDIKSVLTKTGYSCLEPHVFNSQKQVKRKEGAIGVIIHRVVQKSSHIPDRRGHKGAYREDTTDKWHWFKPLHTSL